MRALRGAAGCLWLDGVGFGVFVPLAIWSVSTDGTTVYGTGYNFFGPGNLEGSFAARADGGFEQTPVDVLQTPAS